LFKTQQKNKQTNKKDRKRRRKVARLGHSVCMEMEKFVGLKKVQSLKVLKRYVHNL